MGSRLVPALRERFSTPVHAWGVDHSFVDVTDHNAVLQAVQEYTPSIIVHLAAISAVGAANQDPDTAWRTNLGGTLGLLDAMANEATDAMLFYVSTSEVYGLSLNGGSPATEQTLLQPLNLYATTKAAADLAVRQRAYDGVRSMIVRPFNHVGSGQSENFVVPSFAAQIAAVEAGLRPPVIDVGSLDEERDFLHVDDVIDAYILLLERKSGIASGDVFNVASGRSVRVGDVLEKLLSFSRVKIKIRVDSTRLRHAGIKRVCGDASKLRSHTGWRPRRDIDAALKDVLDEHRRRFEKS